MNSNVAGIDIPESIIKRMEGTPKVNRRKRVLRYVLRPFRGLRNLKV